MAASYYFLDADWRSNTDTPYIPYGMNAFKNVYGQDWLSNHSYLFYNGGSANNNNNNNNNNSKNTQVIESPYLYSYLPSNVKSYLPSFYKSYNIEYPKNKLLSGGNNNKNLKINELLDREIFTGEPLLFKEKGFVGPNPCFQPYRYSNDGIIDPYFLPKIDPKLAPINYYPYGGGNKLKKKNNKSKHLKKTEKKALKRKYTRRLIKKN